MRRKYIEYADKLVDVTSLMTSHTTYHTLLQLSLDE